MLQVTVKRSLWNGNQIDEKVSHSTLLNANTDKMCCIGFACLAASLTPADIAGLCYVHNIERVPIPEFFFGFLDFFAGSAVLSSVLGFSSFFASSV